MRIARRVMTPVVEPPDHEQALDDIDAFISAGHEVAALKLLGEPEFRPAASALCDIAQALTVANGYMVEWLNRFVYFDFRQGGARGEFNTLLQKYENAKGSGEFNLMKIRCGDIWMIYKRDIEGPLSGLPPQNQAVAAEVSRVCYGLGESDDRMVTFIALKLRASIDAFCESVSASLNRSDRNAAETARLHFVVESKDLSNRLVRFTNELSDLVLAYALIAQRPVLGPPPPAAQ
jgi:hypothetical protein